MYTIYVPTLGLFHLYLSNILVHKTLLGFIDKLAKESFFGWFVSCLRYRRKEYYSNGSMETLTHVDVPCLRRSNQSNGRSLCCFRTWWCVLFPDSSLVLLRFLPSHFVFFVCFTTSWCVDLWFAMQMQDLTCPMLRQSEAYVCDNERNRHAPDCSAPFFCKIMEVVLVSSTGAREKGK